MENPIFDYQCVGVYFRTFYFLRVYPHFDAIHALAWLLWYLSIRAILDRNYLYPVVGLELSGLPLSRVPGRS